MKPPGGQRWELYDMATDPSETKDLAVQNPDVLSKLVAIAVKAHQPLEEGTYSTLALHNRDRQAKFGKQDEPAESQKAKARNKAKSKSEKAGVQ